MAATAAAAHRAARLRLLLATCLLGPVAVAASPDVSAPFVSPDVLQARSQPRGSRLIARAYAAGAAVEDRAVTSSSAVRVPIYDFRGDAGSREEALAKFERIDDVIMGGVSKSLLVAGTDGLASWRGLVRTEGGGFCGQRTRPFQAPMDLSGYDGIYISCALSSDADVNRRAWKLALRIDESRGEVIYQAQFVPPVGAPEAVYVPFSAFRLVRGPVAIPGAPRISNTSVVYQIGFTCSKFVIDTRMTQLEGFRNGTFQLDIADIGAYSQKATTAEAAAEAVQAPSALSEGEARRARPFLVRALLLPLFGLLFNEGRRRRARAGRLLMARGTTRLGLVRASWHFKRLRGQGVLKSLLQTVGEGLGTAVVTTLALTAKVLISPVVWLARRRGEKRQGGSAEGK